MNKSFSTQCSTKKVEGETTMPSLYVTQEGKCNQTEQVFLRRISCQYQYTFPYT